MALGVTVDFNANIAKFSGQIDKISNDLGKFQARAESMSSKVSSAFGALGVGLSVAGAAAFVKSGIDAADALNDMADRTGIAVEKLAGLQVATKLADTDMESFASAANKLSINIGKNSEQFAALGITAKDPAEAFLQLADVFSSIEDPQKRAAFGAATLGKSYAEMAPLLLQGGAALREQVKTGQEFSGVTAESARLAAEFNDKLDLMGQRSLGLRTNIALGILEPWTDIAEAMDAAIDRSGIFAGIMGGIINGMRNSAFGTGGGLTAELDALNVKIAEAKQNLQDTKEGGIFGKNSRDEVAANRELNALLSERTTLIAEISDKRKKQDAIETPKINTSAVDAIIGTEGSKKTESSKTKTLDQTLADAARIFEQTRTPLELYTAEMDRLKKLLDSGAISQDTYTRAVHQATQALQEKAGAAQAAGDAESYKSRIEALSLKIATEQALIDAKNPFLQARKKLEDQQARGVGDGLSLVNEGVVNQDGTVNVNNAIPQQPIELPKLNEQAVMDNLAALNTKMRDYLLANPIQQVVDIVVNENEAASNVDIDRAALAGGTR